MKHKQSFQTVIEKIFLRFFEKIKTWRGDAIKIFFKKTKKYFFE